MRGAWRRAIAVSGLLLASGTVAADLGPVHVLPGGPFEASGIVQIPGSNGILFVDDSQPDVVFWLKLSADGSPAGPPARVPLGARVVDPEGMTTDGTHVYVVGSQSRGAGGAGLVRFRFDAEKGQVQLLEAVDLTAILSSSRAVAGASGGKKAALNVEGLAWDAKGGRLLLGLRAPLAGQEAMMVPLTLRNRRGAFAASNLEAGAPLHLDLGGSGIRGIEADPDGGFWVLAGGVSGVGTSRLLRWQGEGSPAKEMATLPGDLKPEGVTRVKVGGRWTTLVLCDTSRYVLLD